MIKHITIIFIFFLVSINVNKGLINDESSSALNIPESNFTCESGPIIKEQEISNDFLNNYLSYASVTIEDSNIIKPFLTFPFRCVFLKNCSAQYNQLLSNMNSTLKILNIIDMPKQEIDVIINSKFKIFVHHTKG
ncbi:hypothetical protein ACTA71_006869 [Dictyostelium dimigraforme]